MIAVVTGCTSTDVEAVAEAAGEAAVAYADGSLGLATSGVWLESGSEATDVYVSGNGACAAVLVQFEPDTLSFVVVLASLDHFTIPEVLDAHPDRFRDDVYPVEEVTELVGDRRWAPTFEVAFTGMDITLEPYREGAFMFGFGPTCETVEQ